jgi:hypothetical protein
MADAQALHDRLYERGKALLDALVAAKADGRVTLAEAWGLFNEFSQSAVLLADIYGQGLAGLEKRAAVDAVAGALFDLVWPIVTGFGWFSFLRLVPASLAKTLLFALLDQVVEATVRLRPQTPATA